MEKQRRSIFAWPWLCIFSSSVGCKLPLKFGIWWWRSGILRSSRRTGPSFFQLAAPQSFWISSGDWMSSGSRAPPLPVSESARSCSAPSIGGTGPRSPDFGGFNLSYFFVETLCLKPSQNATPEGPSTQIVGFQGPKTIQSKTLLFGYLDPLGTI